MVSKIFSSALFDASSLSFTLHLFSILFDLNSPDALAEVGKKYGGGTKYKAVWDRMTQIKEYAKLINEATEAGLDPIDVELTEARKQGSHIAQ